VVKGAFLQRHLANAMNAEGMNALHLAAWSCNVKCVQALICAIDEIDATDAIERTPLALCAQSRAGKERDATALLLIAHGAAPEKGPAAFRALTPGQAAMVGGFHERLFEIMRDPKTDQDAPEQLISFAQSSPQFGPQLAKKDTVGIIQAEQARMAVDKLLSSLDAPQPHP
jgi:ankyrin repeat protein